MGGWVGVGGYKYSKNLMYLRFSHNNEISIGLHEDICANGKLVML
jgi:hypothetical protein